jgi:ketosteroid isomerase-like protein
MSANTETIQAVRDADDRRCRAMTDHDLDALAQLLGDDLVYTHSNARSDSKAEYMANLSSGKVRYREVHRDSVIITLHGDTAVMHGHVILKTTREGTDRTLDNKFLCVWAKKPAGWQMVACASTPIPKT